MAGIPNWIIDGIKKILPNPEIKGNKILCGGDTFNINIHLTNVPTNSDEITFDNDKKEFNINTAALDESKNKQIEQLVYETFEEKKPILIQRSKEMLDDYVKTSQDENILSATKYLHGKVPDNDLTIWHEALYCKSIFDKMIHIPEIKNRQILQIKQKYVKAGIARKYGMRGINIVNLCCSDYIETWFKPLYDALMVQASHIPEEKRIKQFREIYSLIVDHMGITIFVSEKMNEDMINKEFEQKVQYAEIINIHGIGKRNIKVTESFKNKIAVNPDYEIIKSTVEHDVITVIILKVAKKATISTK